MNPGRTFLAALLVGALWPAAAAADTSTFSYTGGEQTFVVPTSAHAVEVVAIGASGGGPVTCCQQAGRGAVVSGVLNVTPNEVLYVEVGGTGGQPTGGFNGGGMGGTDTTGASEFGGGGASDIRLISSSADGSLASRLLVAAGGAGSAFPAAAGGDAGAPGQSNGPSTGGGAGTLTAGGAGGCDPAFPDTGCGLPGTLGIGGAGGASGGGASGREGSGGGGGLYGGGGGAGVMGGNAVGGGEVGGGGGGSSLVPANGLLTLAPLGTPPSVVITALPSAGGNDLPVEGTGSGTVTFDPATSGGTTQTAGELSHLGAFTASGPYHITVTGFPLPLVTYDLSGTTTYVAANGDELFGTVTGIGTNNIITGDASGLNVVTIAGGTGRFADASGMLAVSYTTAGGTITGTTQGEIGY